MQYYFINRCPLKGATKGWVVAKVPADKVNLSIDPADNEDVVDIVENVDDAIRYWEKNSSLTIFPVWIFETRKEFKQYLKLI